MCRGPAIIDLKRHNANFCPDHFRRFCRDQVARAISDFDMFRPDDRVLVAVSGGKDSLALWDILLDLGYDAEGLYIGLGIGDYSDVSGSYARAYASTRGARLTEVDLVEDHGFDIPSGSRAARRNPCSACGLSKRHIFDRAALDGGFDAVVTGHNLDDEAAVLFGNVLRWQTEYLRRQHPVLPERDGFPRKAKPLVRLSERETAAYCIVGGIDYLVEECPMSSGNKHLGYKEVLNDLEVRSPGTKADFYFSFLRRGVGILEGDGPVNDDGGDEADDRGIRPCSRCGSPSSAEVCAFCRLVERAGGRDRREARSQRASGAVPAQPVAIGRSPATGAEGVGGESSGEMEAT